MRAVLLTGGIYHDFDQMSAAVAGILGSAGFATEIVTSPAALVKALEAPATIVVVQGLRFRMLGNEKYAPFRAEWAYETGADLIAALEGHAARGGGLMALHTGCISFDDWQGWHRLLGGGWVWGQSFHAPGLEPVEVRPIAHHPVTEGIAPFTVTDEHYRKLAISEAALPLMEGKTAEGETHPVAWAVTKPSRAFTLTLGHDLASITHPQQARLIRQAALWAANRQAAAETQGVAP